MELTTSPVSMNIHRETDVLALARAEKKKYYAESHKRSWRRRVRQLNMPKNGSFTGLSRPRNTGNELKSILKSLKR